MTGRWVQRGATKVWIEVAAAPAEPKTYDPSKLIACATCRAKVTETCKTERGDVRQPHVLRFAPRLCGCGALLGWRRQLCDACALESMRASKREYMRRKRAS